MNQVKAFPLNRRSFMRNGLLAGGAAIASADLLNTTAIRAQTPNKPTDGDIAILRFLAAAELIEADLWQQYNELGGVNNNGITNSYINAFKNLDDDGPKYITGNTNDEISHAAFLNAYIESKGGDPVDFDSFRTLQGSMATGAQNIGRLTNLGHLNVDTSWYTRYRSTKNPDFGDTFPQALTITNRQSIPLTDADFNDPKHIQVIADIAAFHFGTIEQAGSSLYSALSQKVTSPEVLEITIGILGSEVAHYLEWVDFAGSAVEKASISDGGTTIPDFEGNENLDPDTIFPVACEFINKKLPHCAVVRPLSTQFGGAQAATQGLIAMNLFQGQPKRFTNQLMKLAVAADAATRSI